MKASTSIICLVAAPVAAFQSGATTARTLSWRRQIPPPIILSTCPNMMSTSTLSIASPVENTNTNSNTNTNKQTYKQESPRGTGSATANLLLSDRMTTFFDSRFSNKTSLPVPQALSTLAFKLIPAQLLVQGSLKYLAGPYQQSLAMHGNCATLLFMSVATLLPIFLGIGLQMLPYFIPAAGADKALSKKTIMKNLRKTKKMLPVAGKFSLLLVITSFLAMMTCGNISSIPQSFNIVGYGIRRAPLFLVADLVFHSVHRVAHMGKSNNPIVRKIVKSHRTHHLENGTGVLPINMLHQDFMEGLEDILVAMIVIAPFNGAHPLVLFPLWAFIWGYDGAAAHSSSIPLADGGFHLDHHVHQQGNYGLGMIADRLWGTMVSK